MKRFLEHAPEEEAPPSAAGGGGGGGGADREARELLEHGAFLSMWLSLFVLPGPPFDVVRREVLPLAARLARGQSVALAPAALAAIYHDLSALKRRITSGKKNEGFVVSARHQRTSSSSGSGSISPSSALNQRPPLLEVIVTCHGPPDGMKLGKG
jgi:hypothetical protein